MCVRERECEAENEVFLHLCIVSCHINKPISLMAGEKLIFSVYQHRCVFAGAVANKALKHSAKEFISILRTVVRDVKS